LEQHRHHRVVEFRVGTASWTDPSLVNSDLFYPLSVRSAEGRLRFYVERFNTVEVDSTYYALPSERNARLWAERTPEGFLFNIKPFALMTQHPAEIARLPKELSEMLPIVQHKERRLTRPSPEVVDRAFQMFWSALAPVATENSENAEKSRVSGSAAIVFWACLDMRVPSSRLLLAVSAVGPFWNWRTSPSVTSCMFIAASDRVGPGCLRSTGCSGSGFTDCGRAAWTQWCWSSQPPSSNGTVTASACFGAGVRDPDGRQWIARFAS